MIDDYKMISYGTRALIRLEGIIHELQIVEGKEIDPKQGKISADSPVGQALLRKREKERFGLILPSRKILDCEILKIF